MPRSFGREIEVIASSFGAITFGTLLNVLVIVCSFIAIFLLITMWGTRWGDRNSLSKSLILSVLVHACIALEWKNFIVSHQMSAQTIDASSAEPVQPTSEAAQVPIQLVYRDFRSPIQSHSGGGIGQSLSGAAPTAFDRTIPDAQNRQQFEEVNSDPKTSDPPTVREPLDFPEFTKSEPAEMPALLPDAETPRPIRSVNTPKSSIIDEPAEPEVRKETRTVNRTRNMSKPDLEAPSLPPASVQRNRRQGETKLPADSLSNETLLNVPNNAEPGQQQIRRQFDAMSSNVKNTTEGMKANIRTPRVPRDRINVAERIINGRVIDADTGVPLAGVAIRFDRQNGDPLTAVTNKNGNYSLTVTETPDQFVMTASQRGYLPSSRNMQRSEVRGDTPQLDFSMFSTDDRVIAVEEDPRVHHLGNDRFEGSANSQFQRRSEGESLKLKFPVAKKQFQARPRLASVTLMAKGVQCPFELRINGIQFDARMTASPGDGSFAPMSFDFNPNLLKEGDNFVELKATSCQSDLDDFEFVNVQIRLINVE